MPPTANALRAIIAGLVTCGISATVTAQDAASTLARLVEAPVLVQTRVLAVEDDGQLRRAVCKVQIVLKGHLEGTFVLSEPAGRTCGRALHSVTVGASYLVFLDVSGPQPRLVANSSRALVTATPPALDHVRALLAGKSATERLTVLTGALRSPDERVRDDAALALPLFAGLEQASGGDRERILAALGNRLSDGDRSAFALIRTATRLRLRAAVPMLLTRYLAGDAGTLEVVLRKTIPAIDSEYAIDLIERSRPARVETQFRAIDLLEQCSGTAATACLTELAKSRVPAVRDRAEAAVSRRHATDHSPDRRFRSIRPRSKTPVR